MILFTLSETPSYNPLTGVAEDFDRLVQLLDLERLFQN
jgi:hypothetical protein